MLSEYVEILRNTINPDINIEFGKKDYYPYQPMYLVADVGELKKIPDGRFL